MKEENILSITRGKLWIWVNKYETADGEKFFRLGTNANCFGHYNDDRWYDVPNPVIHPNGDNFGWILKFKDKELILTFTKRSQYLFDVTDTAPFPFNVK